MAKRKIVALALALAMATTTLLAGCGQQTKQSEESKSDVVSSQEPSETQMTEASKEEELEPYTVTYWIYGDESKDHELVLEKMNERIQEFLPNTTLEIVYVNASEYKDRWTKALAAEEKIDLGWAADWANDPNYDVNNGTLLPIRDLLEEYGQGIVDELGWDLINLHPSVDGDYYFVPAWQGVVGGRDAVVLQQNIVDLMPQGWLEETEKFFQENLDFAVEPKKQRVALMNEYLETAAANNLIGDGIRFNASCLLIERIFQQDIWRFNSVAYVDEKDGVFTVGNYFASDVIKLECETAADWYQKGYVRSDVASAETTNTYKYILTATDAFQNDWLNNIKNTYEPNGQDVTGFTIQAVNQMNDAWDTGTVIPYTSENPERAMQVLNLFYADPELYRLLIYGIEGTHYTLNADGTITLPAKDARTYIGPENWKTGTCMNSLYEAGKSGQKNYAEFKEMEKTADENPLIGFIFDTANVSNEIANCNAVKGEYQGIVLRGYYGDKWEACYNEFLQKLEEAGVQKVVDELRSQLKVFVEKNNLGTVAE